jgi:hypothetical protein
MSRFDSEWNATWGENPIHYLRHESRLQRILDKGVIEAGDYGVVFATPLRDFPPEGRVTTEILPPGEYQVGLEIYDAKGWHQGTPPTIWAHIGNVAIALHPTLTEYQDTHGRRIIPVVQREET